MPFFCTTAADGQITGLYSSDFGNVPEGAQLLSEEDFFQIQRGGGDFSAFNFTLGRAERSTRKPGAAAAPETAALRAEIDELKAVVIELINSAPQKTVAADALVQRLSAGNRQPPD